MKQLRFHRSINIFFRIREWMLEYGAVLLLAKLVQLERENEDDDPDQTKEIRRFSIIALTNLSYGNPLVKACLIQLQGFIPLVMTELDLQSEDCEDSVSKAAAHLFRNLSWQANTTSASILAESCLVRLLLCKAVLCVEGLSGLLIPC